MSDDKFRCRYCDKFRHVSEFEGFKTDDACMRCKAPKPTPDDKPKWIELEKPPIKFWALPFREAGKQKLAFSFDGPRSPAYGAYVEYAALLAAEKRIEELATELGRAENEAKRVYGAEIDKLEEQLTAAQAERDALRAQAEALALELEIILSTFESAVHDQYDGTSSLDERLAEMEPARKALAEYRSDK